MSKMFNNYIGKAGQLFAMSEFLILGWNVAIPEVDRGDDIFVVQDADGTLRRVQVKTAQAKSLKKGYSVQFSIPRAQIRTPRTPEIDFLFLIRYNGQWSDLVMIQRPDLETELAARQSDEDSKSDKLTLRFNLDDNKIMCGKIDFSAYQNLASRFPRIEH